MKKIVPLRIKPIPNFTIWIYNIFPFPFFLYLLFWTKQFTKCNKGENNKIRTDQRASKDNFLFTLDVRLYFFPSKSDLMQNGFNLKKKISPKEKSIKTKLTTVLGRLMILHDVLPTRIVCLKNLFSTSDRRHKKKYLSFVL